MTPAFQGKVATQGLTAPVQAFSVRVATATGVPRILVTPVLEFRRIRIVGAFRATEVWQPDEFSPDPALSREGSISGAGEAVSTPRLAN